MTELDRATKSKQIFTNVILAIVFMFSFSAFSQVDVTNSISEESTPMTTSTQVGAAKSSSNMEFVLWFMGSKQNPNPTISTEDNASTRHQIMTSGLAPNRLLIKAFLKKAVNFESSMA
ncbi:hypothetical protein FFWV33_00135 [Flavobacterium faecale]|uniref:Uncharacterized protein n=1 Tax=Flavobacterium faecale TaxID=1355330 RepID=A0A2S1L8I8_9FLAO|nr:hypothetical protein [Flavobacterium faecale]AWG20041.1 hypothetical protein FFWV33_00135 [Flavobacterium faecale]